jgi:N-acetylglutamate synthase-like GNAT family acetyltransferase
VGGGAGRRRASRPALLLRPFYRVLIFFCVMSPFELRRESFLISTDRARHDLDAVHALLRATHWAKDMSRDVLNLAFEHSLCFGLFDGERQVGFARLITDYCTYAYLTDVVIAAEYRGRGLGKWLMEAMLAHPDLNGMRRIALLTLDAERLYEQFGFATDTGKLIYMERRRPPRE